MPRSSRHMTLPKSDLPQGTLDLLILKVVALGPLHGYAIIQRLQQISRDVVQVQQGSLYPALHRLENRRLLAAEWKISDTGRPISFSNPWFASSSRPPRSRTYMTPPAQVSRP